MESVERVTGIEPAWPAWKAGALPLSYTRGFFGVAPITGAAPFLRVLGDRLLAR